MFNQDTLSVLSTINGITNSVILKYPQTVAVSESQDMRILINMQSLDSEPFPDIGLMDSLSDFLGLFNLFPDDREVDITDSVINIQSGTIQSSYISDNTALMSAFDIDAAQFAKTEEVPNVAEFSLEVADMKRVFAASGVFKDLSEVIFTSKDDDVTISLGATNKFNAKSNTFSCTKTNINASKEFVVKIPVENFKMLPVSDYEVQIKYHSARDAYRILLINKSLDGIKILMSVKV